MEKPCSQMIDEIISCLDERGYDKELITVATELNKMAANWEKDNPEFDSGVQVKEDKYGKEREEDSKKDEPEEKKDYSKMSEEDMRKDFKKSKVIIQFDD